MKALNIRHGLALFLLLYEGRVEAQFLRKIEPDHVVVQHAGSIGYVSGGIGYELFKNNRGNIELVYGYVPEKQGGSLHILSTKFAYRPFQIKIKDKLTIYPLNPGVFFSYHFGKQFDISFDDTQYEKGYYGWSTAIRGHISLSNEIKLHTGKKNFVAAYSEFNASDLYLVSLLYQDNKRALTPKDIVKLGIGVKVGF